MKKNVFKKLIGKKSTGILVTILAFVIFFGAIFSVSNVMLAKDTLPGIGDIRDYMASANDEYKVLEIVPTLDTAQFGYLVGGEEPLDATTLYDNTTKNWITWKEYLIKNIDTKTPAERESYMADLANANAMYLTTTAGDLSKPMWYKPYIEIGVTPETADGMFQGGSVEVHGWLVSDDTKTEGWNAKFTRVDGKTYDQWVAEATPYYIVNYNDPGAETPLTNDIINANPAIYPDHYYTYKKDISGTYFVPSVTFGQLKADIADGGLVDTGDDNTDVIENYYILKFKVFDSGDYTADSGPAAIYAASDFVYLNQDAPYKIPNQSGKGHDLTEPSQNIYYQGGFYSNEMFKKFTLDIDDADVANYKVDVQTVTAGELNAMTAEDLATYLTTVDFIYLNAGENTTSGVVSYKPGNAALDLDAEAVKLIFEKICNEKTPCIVDYYLNDLSVIDVDITNTNAYALACMLMQSDYRNLITNGSYNNISGNLNSWVGTIVSTNDHNYVNGNVMVVHSAADVKWTDNYYGTAYTNDVIKLAYAPVLKEIEIENLYRASDQEAGYAQLDTTIYKSTVVRYIVNYVGARAIQAKTSFEVLEIQPARVEYPGDLETSSTTKTMWTELKPSTIRDWMGVDDSVSVHITTMTTNEFVGKIEDMNSEYDLIYIGADVYGMPNSKRTLHGEEDYWTDYSDNTMDGMIYANVGDIKGIRSQFAGQLATDYKENTDPKSTVKIIKNDTNTRFSNNDISAGKHNELVDYVKATYPIVVSDKLSEDNVNPSEKTLDNCSYLYSFLKENLDERNVFTVREVSDGNNAQFQFYANRAKLSIGTKVVADAESTVEGGTAFVQPGELKSDQTNGQVTYLSKDADGKFYLKYKFKITNNGAVYSYTQYTASLYLDSNSDGKYSAEFEELPDITLTHMATGNVVKNGELLVGEQYTLSKQVPESYSGLLNWKVEVKQTDNPYIRDSIIGHTKLEDPDKGAEKIKVLHVYKDSGSVLNLETAIGNKASDNGNNDILETLVWGGEVTYNNKKYKFDGITDDYVFEFTSIRNRDFNDSYKSGYLYKNGTKTSQKFNLMDYDMFVLGFYDSYSIRGSSNNTDIDEQAINGPNGIKEFIDSGKSVLFAHDTTSFIAVAPNEYKNVRVDKATNTNIYDYSGYTCSVWAYTLNKNIRDMVGLDAYGVSLGVKDGINYSRLSSGVALKDTDTDTSLKTALTNTLDENGHYKVGIKSLAYKPGSNKTETVPEVQGLTYSWAELWDVKDSVHYRKNTNGYTTVSKAERVNEGQITTYPYYVGDSITTATTHSQYFFLDLSADDDNDNETDLVVWYTLAGATVYNASPKDVVNNYYIYNKGNITYTGIGHSANSTTIDEGKLFINTMVAAYNSKKNIEPSVSVFESEEGTMTTDTFYEYGDNENDVSFRAGSQKMYFSINDMNVIRGTKVVNAEYYVALKPNTVDENATTYTTPEGVTYQVYKDTDGTQYIKLTNLKTYTTAGQEVASNELQLGVMYYVDIPTDVFDITGVKGQNTNTFMLAANTILRKVGAITGLVTEQETEVSYNKINFVQLELFPLD